MQKVLVAVCGLLLNVEIAAAADMPGFASAPPVLWSWTGFYVGGYIGGGLANSQFSDPTGHSLYGGIVSAPAALGGLQAGYNWQAANSNWVLGVETDTNLLDSDGTGTCLASSGLFISANCRVRQTAGGSLTGRVGFATGNQGRTLLYAKGGAAWLKEQIDITTNAVYPITATTLDTMRLGWTLGAGAEKALTPAWSIKLEYDYADFGRTNMATPASYFLMPTNSYVKTAGSTTGLSQNSHTVKMGLNYKLGEDMNAQWKPSASDYRLRGSSDTPYIADAEVEVGGRVWYSSGRYQKDLGSTSNQSQQNILNSRLTYDTTAASGELFGRIDSSSNIFIKGFAGGGGILSGRMHDEDWLIFNDNVPYSNTVSNPVTGNLSYATADVGYSIFRGPSSKIGGFIGYNYFQEKKSAYGCSQIANNNSDCVPPIPNSTLGITEDNTWKSFRVGLNGVVNVMDRLTLTADVAYLPFVSLSGRDNHLLRTDVSNTVSTETGNGQGVQLEAVMAYSFENSFVVGAGARYWGMWATNASTNIFGTPCPCQTLPSRTERYGAFLQASYKLDGLK